MAYSDPASEKQISLIQRLFPALSEKLDAAQDSPEAVQVTEAVTSVQDVLVRVLQGAAVTKGEVSPAIDVLFSADKLLTRAVAATVTPGIVNAERIISNKFGKACSVCQADVPAGAGHAALVVGKWATFCAQCAAETPEVRQERLAASPPPAAPQRAADPAVGVYVDPETGHLVRVYMGTQSGRLNGKRNDGHGWTWTGRRDFAIAVPANQITAEQAAAFGHTNDECVFCGRSLEDPRSNATGYGPVCADRYGLPWGETVAVA